MRVAAKRRLAILEQTLPTTVGGPPCETFGKDEIAELPPETLIRLFVKQPPAA